MKQLSIRVLAPLLIVSLIALAPVRAQNGTPASLNGFDGFVEQVMKDWHVPGIAVAIVKDGRTVYAKGYGFRDEAVKAVETCGCAVLRANGG